MKKGIVLFFALVLYGFGQNIGDNTQIHGFGGVAYGKTDGNAYLLGTDDGSFDNYNMAFNISSKIDNHLMLFTQFEFLKQQGFAEDEPEVETELDYAYGEYRFSDLFKLRIGLVQHPFGLYTEIYDVGTVRPFYSLPQGIYGPLGFVTEGYSGIGALGTVYSGSWGFSYDVYAGDVDGEVAIPETEFEIPGGEEIELGGVKDVIGGRLNILTPLEGLMFGVSGYTGKAEGYDETTTVMGSHVEYLTEKLSLRAEYAQHEVKDITSETAYYAEGAYKITENWEVALRYDNFESEIDDPMIDMLFSDDALKHNEIAAGLNYWFSPNFVVRLSYHMVDGNRLTGSGEDEEMKDKTTMFLFGGNFSF